MLAPAATLKSIQDLYDQGRYLSAFEACQPLGPLRDWQGVDARVFASRLAGVLGARRLSDWLAATAYRADPQHAEARLFFGFHMVYRRGPLAAAEWLDRQGDLTAAAPRVRADWRALRARVLALLRDFAASDEWMRKADAALDAPRAWLDIERATILEQQDRLDDALASVLRALALRPDYRPAVQHAADLLSKLGRNEEAVELLSAAATKLECGDVEYQLASVLLDLDRHHEAIQSLERAIAYWPLCDGISAMLLAARMETACYLAGQRERAAEFARFVGGDFHNRFAERLLDPDFQGRRVALPLTHVQQHADTCAPATLTMIGRYWSRPVDHLELLEQICYDGTPHHAQRKWAEEAGFVVRTFTVTPECARALIDRGMPFALMTAGPGWSHLQAVAGYDDFRGTLLIRNPNFSLLSEYMLEQTLESNRFSGPQGMVLVPFEHADRLKELELPDTDHHDRLYQIDLALLAHDREAAGQRLQEQRDAAPHHFLTIHARRILARYDNDWETMQQCAEALAVRFPEDPLGAVERYWSLRELERREQWLSVLETAVSAFPDEGQLKVMLAREWCADARRWPDVERLLRQALRWRPTHAESLDLLGSLRWQQLRRGEAVNLARWAASLEDKREQWSINYFRAAWDQHRLPEAQGFLADRVERYGARSSGPARTLAWAHEQLGQMERAREVLAAALQRRPDDGELLLAAADVAARHHHREESEQLLERARTRTPAADWHRAAAQLAVQRGDFTRAIEHWEAVVEAAPLDSGAYRELALLVRDSLNNDAAVGRLREAVERFPYNYRLHQVLIEFLAGARPEEHLAAVRRLLEAHPIDAWAHRELAIGLVTAGRLEDAFVEADLGLQLDPASPSSWTIRGMARGPRQSAAARDDYHEALRHDPDWTSALGQAWELGRSEDERRATLRLHYGELLQHGNIGVGIEAYAYYARDVLSDAELRSDLEGLRHARPDVWQTWVVLAEAYLQLGLLDDALQCAREAAERFPHAPRVWQSLAAVHAARDEQEAQLEALERALRVPAAAAYAAQRIGFLRQEAGDLGAARDVLERTLAQHPRDASLAALLALVLWKLGERDEALSMLQRSLRFEPHYPWAWDRYEEWTREMGRPQLALDAARDLVARRPGDVESWLNLARRVTDPAESATRLAALDRALGIDPRSIDAHQLKAYTLAEVGRPLEALAAAEHPVWGEGLPAPLRATAADIVARSDFAAGIARLEALVLDEPRYGWAWRQLTDWYRQAGRPDDYLRAAQHWTTVIDPREPQGWGHLGTAYEQRGAGEQALAAYHHALQLDPTYAYAGMAIADLQIEAGRLAEATAALDAVRDDDLEGVLALRRLRGAARQGQWPVVAQWIEHLCRLPGADTNLAQVCAEELRKAGFRLRAEPLVRGLLAQPDSGAFASALWLACFATRAEASKALARWRDDGAAWQRTARHWLETLIASNDGRTLKRFWRRLRRRFQADTQTWATAGRALGTLVDMQRAERWLGDYARRPDREAWMLAVLAYFQWLRRRDRKVEKTASDALSLPPDASAASLWTYRAAVALLRGAVDASAEYVAKARAAPSPGSNYAHAMRAVVEAALAEIDAAGATPDFRAARRRFWVALQPFLAILGDRQLRRLADGALYRVARAHGSLWGAVYYGLQQHANLRIG